MTTNADYGTRYVCGWCPTELPDDRPEWAHHHFIAHGQQGYSVRHYRALTIEQEMATLSPNDGSVA